jgi:hypothetical protein
VRRERERERERRETHNNEEFFGKNKEKLGESRETTYDWIVLYRIKSVSFRF